MHTIHLIASAIASEAREQPPPPIEPGICAVSGEHASRCIHRRHLLGKSFTSQSLLRAPSSQHVSVDAWAALTYRPERQSSWWCDGSMFTALNRAGVRSLIIDHPPSSPRWAGYITTSYKKHGALLAPINSGSRAVWQFELIRVDCSDRVTLLEWWQHLRRAQDQGISRAAMTSLEISPGILAHLGLPAWQAFREWAADKYRSALYSLLVYLLPSLEEIKAGKQ